MRFIHIYITIVKLTHINFMLAKIVRLAHIYITITHTTVRLTHMQLH